MKKTMILNTDFVLQDKKNGYGYTHEVVVLNDGTEIKPECEPKQNSAVYYYDSESKELYLSLIKSGNWLSNGRLSNFWYWQRIDENLNILSEVYHGYGNFFEANSFETILTVAVVDISIKE